MEDQDDLVGLVEEHERKLDALQREVRDLRMTLFKVDEIYFKAFTKIREQVDFLTSLQNLRGGKPTE